MKIKKRHSSNDDIVKSTLSEVILFLLFMALILLGETQDIFLRAATQEVVNDPDSSSVSYNLRLPILIYSEETENRFASNSAVLSTEFEDWLENQGIKEIETVLARFKAFVSVIEVIGHTDDVPVGPSNKSNLDATLTSFLSTGSHITSDKLKHSDNAGLGLARAASVAAHLKETLGEEFDHIQIIPMSASNLVYPDGTLNRNQSAVISDVSRRRIEIRFR